MTALPADLAAHIDSELRRAPPVARPHVPGRVYQQRRAAERGARRADGSYFTPPHLVDFVVDRVVGPMLAHRSADEALALRIVDPACGAGVFLLGVLDAYARRFGADVAARAANQCALGIDVDPIAAELCRMAVRLAYPGAEPVVACGDAIVGDLPLPGPFDAVVGNPPWGQKGFALSADAKAHVRERYTCGRGVIDPYALFVERATDIGERWGFVLPDIVLLKNQQDVRDVVLERCAIEHIAHAGRAFDGVALDVVAIAARRGTDPAHRVSVWHELPPTWRTAPPPTHEIPQARFLALPGHKLNLHITDASFALWQKLDALPVLGERFEAHEGVHTGNARAKLFVDDKRNDRCVPVIVGKRELRRDELVWGGRWLDLSPDALDRAAGDYANLGRPEWHQRPKIVVRRTGDHVVAAFDDRGYYCSNNMFVVLPRAPMSNAEQRAYVAWLNSALVTWYFRTVQPRRGRLFAELKIHHLLDFPVPPGPLGEQVPTDDDVFARCGLDADEIALVRSAR